MKKLRPDDLDTLIKVYTGKGLLLPTLVQKPICKGQP